MIVQSDSLEWLKQQEADSIDHIITDPPYLIDFMAKKWDSKDNVAGSVDYWKEALRVCKAGSYALVFGHSRTHHRVMTAMEDAGWDIRDCLMWVQGQGFPKSHELGAKIDKAKGLLGHRGKRVKHQVGQEELDKPEHIAKHEPISAEAKEWSGWGENLKPAYEPIIMARKPFKGSLTNNVLTNKLGALNIDACRVGTEVMPSHTTKTETTGIGWEKHGYTTPEAIGRHPANVILDEEAAKSLDEQSGITKDGTWNRTDGARPFGNEGKKTNYQTTKSPKGSGGASRFFYVAKVSAKERNFGCEEREIKQETGGGGLTEMGGAFGSIKAKGHNHHPTLKPIELMKWLVKLVSKEGQTILDPFMGSGSTGIAVELLGRNFIGVEMDADYCDIAERRITAWKEKQNDCEEPTSQVG